MINVYKRVYTLLMLFFCFLYIDGKIPTNSCNVEGTCQAELTITEEAGIAQNCSITQDMPAVSAFFSLAALAEVAAMENVHRLAISPGYYFSSLSFC